MRRGFRGQGRMGRGDFLKDAAWYAALRKSPGIRFSVSSILPINQLITIEIKPDLLSELIIKSQVLFIGPHLKTPGG